MIKPLLSPLRLPALCVILLLSYLAYSNFATQNRLGFLYLGLAGILLAVFALPWSPTAYLPEARIDLTAGRRRWIAIFLLGISILLMLDAGRIFVSQLQINASNTSEPWDRFAPGLALWIAGGLLLTRGVYSFRFRPAPLLLVILGIAVFLRIYLLDTLPLGIWHDESEQAMRAIEMLRRSDLRQIFDGHSFFQQFLYAGMLEIFGRNNITAIRIVEAAFGVAGVVTGYMVGKQVRSQNFGLLMAAILATMHWSIVFSRMAMNCIEVIFFVLLSLYFAIRVVRHGHFRDAMLLGLTIGTGLWFYRSFQFVVIAIVLLLFTAWGAHSFKRLCALGFVVIANIIAIVFPLGLYAAMRSEFFARVRVTSIFYEGFPLQEALAKTIPAHLEMFHIMGDRNGRHNLPGAPMLDPITGILFGLGLVIAVRYWRRRENFFFVTAFLLGLLPAILTVTFEAPQSLRSIGVVPSVAYFAALGALTLGQTIQAALPPTRIRWIPTVSILGLVLVLTGLNYKTYFQDNAFNYDAWISHSTVETMVGRIMAAQDGNTHIVSSQLYFRHPSIRFLAPEQVERTELLTAGALPARLPPEQKMILFFAPTERPLFEQAQQLYHNGTFHTFSSQEYGVEPSRYEPDLFYTAELQPEDIASIQGINENEDGSGIFYAPEYRDYHFVLSDGTTVQLNGETFTEPEFTVRLARGPHQLRLEPSDSTLFWMENGETQPVPEWLLYHEPVRWQGVRAAYYANADWQGDPVTIETHPSIYELVHILPMSRPYSVRYTGQLYVPVSGEYTFYIDARDYARFSIDGEIVLEPPQTNHQFSQVVTLNEGWHDIEVLFQDITSHTYIFLQWKMPDSDEVVPIAADYLRPS